MDLQQILIVIGVVVLVLLVGHGVWASRKEKSQMLRSNQRFESAVQINNTSSHQTNASESVSAQTYVPTELTKMEAISTEQQYTEDKYVEDEYQPVQESLPLEEASVEQAVEKITITLPQQVDKKEDVPHYQYTPEPMPSASVLAQKTIADLENEIDPEEGINTSSELLRRQLEEAVSQAAPQIKVNEMATARQDVEVEQQAAVEKVEKPTHIILYVVSSQNSIFNGSQVLNILSDLGFIFGQHQIYHRHVDLTTASPIIFSIANMLQPGVFDPNNVESFTTQGLSLFMKLPSPGNDLANFRIMLKVAETLAESLNGFILNDKREIFTEESKSEYIKNILA